MLAQQTITQTHYIIKSTRPCLCSLSEYLQVSLIQYFLSIKQSQWYRFVLGVEDRMQIFYQERFRYFLFPFVLLKVLSNDFKAFLSHIIMVFPSAVFEHVELVISSIVVFNAFMYVTCSFTNVTVLTCWYRTLHMIYQVLLVFRICFVFDVQLGT